MKGLPCPSLALGINSEGRPADPTQCYWVAPLLHVLAEKASYRPRVFFTPDIALRDEVIRAAGYDTTKPKTLPRPLAGVAKPQGLRHLVYAAACSLRGDIVRSPPIPLVVFRKDNPTNSKEVAKWALTEAGIAVATSLRKDFATDGRNVTNVWLNGQIEDHNLYQRLIQAVRYAPSTCKERESGEVQDHVGHFLATRIKNDSFATRLATCDPPTFRELRVYTLRATYTTFKRRAQNPIHREGCGALTDSEREAGGPSPASMIISKFARVFQTTDCIRSEGVVVTEVFVDKDATDLAMHRLDFERGMDKVREAFRRYKPGNHERIHRIFNFMASGKTVAEIGVLENVTRNRAATLMADVRRALREARQASTDALKVLEYIAEEPYATVADMEEDLILASKMSVLVQGLVENGRLDVKDSTTRGHKDSVTSYVLTKRGQGFIRERTNSSAEDSLLESLSL